MKALLKSWLARVGYEVRNVRGLPEDVIPPWTEPGTPWPTDEVVPGEWATNVLEMATHAHRPPRLEYHRRRSGEDPRIKHCAFFLDLRGARVLELGPYEGYWSVLLEKLGVAANVAVEVRPENLAKCERIKALHCLDRTTFVRQDIEALYRGQVAPAYSGPFDLVFCLGLLYHLPEPAKALKWMRTQAPRLFLGTHYVEPLEARRYLPHVLREAEHAEGGKTYRGMEYREGGLADPISGVSSISFWPGEADLLAMLRDAGYGRVEILGKDLLNRMPHITLLAE